MALFHFDMLQHLPKEAPNTSFSATQSFVLGVIEISKDMLLFFTETKLRIQISQGNMH